IPAFTPVGQIMVLRIQSVAEAESAGRVAGAEYSKPRQSHAVTSPAGDSEYLSPGHTRRLFRELAKGRFASPVGDPRERSVMTPVWLAAADGTACGCLEDTRRAKRLIADDDAEMISAHLSSFAYRNPQAGADLVRSALAYAEKLGYPAL